MLKIGFSKIDITPTLPCELGGYAVRTHGADMIAAPLFARALTVSDGATVWVLLSMDLLGVSLAMADDLEKSVKCAHGSHIHVSVIGTHTHGAPNGLPQELDYGLWTEKSSHVPTKYYETVFSKAKDCIANALTVMTEAEPRWTVAECKGVYMNRRDRTIPFDPRLHLLEFTLKSGEILGGLVHLACHPTVVDPLAYHVTADIPGYLTSQLESGHDGAVYLFANGAAGDVSTRFTRKEATEAEAERLASKAHYVLRNAAVVPGTQELSFHDFRDTYPDRMTGRSLPVLYQAIDLAGKRLVFFPGELYAKYALEAMTNRRDTLIIGYANGYLGYIPDKASYGERGYEAEACRLTEESIQKVTDTLKRMAEE